jgi:hypothetical protein
VGILGRLSWCEEIGIFNVTSPNAVTARACDEDEHEEDDGVGQEEDPSNIRENRDSDIFLAKGEAVEKKVIKACCTRDNIAQIEGKERAACEP